MPWPSRAVISAAASHGRSAARAGTLFAGCGGVGSAEGVRLKRGAGAGCTIPSISAKVLRAARCACFGASLQSSTGVTQVLLPSKTRAHSSRVRVLNFSVSTARSFVPVRALEMRRMLRGIETEPGHHLGEELVLYRRDDDPATIGAAVGFVERRAREKVAALVPLSRSGWNIQDSFGRTAMRLASAEPR